MHPSSRVNYRIRVRTVRCIGADGEMLGIMATRDALRLAQERRLDLVEISPNADPPVCRIMDFGKFRYEQSKKDREARKHQVSRSVKEIKFHVNVAENDFEIKVGHMRGFLEKGHKVKVSLQFKGRENLHRELGFEVMKRALKELEDVCVVDQPPRTMGRTLLAMIGPRSGKSGGAKKPAQPSPAQPRTAPPSPAQARPTGQGTAAPAARPADQGAKTDEVSI